MSTSRRPIALPDAHSMPELAGADEQDQGTSRRAKSPAASAIGRHGRLGEEERDSVGGRDEQREEMRVGGERRDDRAAEPHGEPWLLKAAHEEVGRGGDEEQAEGVAAPPGRTARTSGSPRGADPQRAPCRVP
jgi:hypothetical protein